MRARRYAQTIMRRGVILGLALIALSLALQAHPSGDPVSFTTSKDIRQYVEGSHLIRSLTFDKGALRLDPPSTTPRVTEAHALALWESRSLGCCQYVAEVNVFLADATLGDLPKIDPANGFAAPRFASRSSWVITWRFGGSHGCPSRMGPLFQREKQTVPEPTHVMMIAADRSGQGVEYRTSGAFCGYPNPASAEAAKYGLSVPWTIVSEHQTTCRLGQPSSLCGSVAKTATIKLLEPVCARSSGGSSGGPVNGPSTLQAFVDVPMTGQPCTRVKQEISAVSWSVFGHTVHAPTGLIPALRTSDHMLVYFDGSSHTLRFSS